MTLQNNWINWASSVLQRTDSTFFISNWNRRVLKIWMWGNSHWNQSPLRPLRPTAEGRRHMLSSWYRTVRRTLVDMSAVFRKHFFKLTGLKVWLWKLGFFHFHKVTSFHCWVKRDCCFLKPTSPSFIFSVVSCAYPFLYCSPGSSHSADEYFIPWALKREHTKHTGG